MTASRNERKPAGIQVLRPGERTYDRQSHKKRTIMQKWSNIRDSFLRSLRTKSGQGAKKNIYSENLQFLLKISERDTESNFSQGIEDVDDSSQSQLSGIPKTPSLPQSSLQVQPVASSSKENMNKFRKPKRQLDVIELLPEIYMQQNQCNTDTFCFSSMQCLKPKLNRLMNVSCTKDSMSLNSPPGIHSPKDFANNIPKEIASLSEQLQNLIMGRVAQVKTATRTRKIVIYVSAADSQDCCVEKGSLHNTVYPELRAHCRSKGYELHIIDLHWKTLLEKQQDHEFPELCIGELNRQMEVAYIIPVLFLNNSLGTPLLPITIESADFKMAMESTVNQSAQSLLSKWYQLDSAAQPPCYRLQPISSHIPGFKETTPEERERGLEEWKSEIERMLDVLVNIFSQELRDTYLTTVVEQEVHNTVFMSQELAKRCIWLNRVYTPNEKTPENLSPGEAELHRRLNTLQRDLRNQLAEKHIVRIPVKFVEGGLNMKISEHVQYINQVTVHLRKHLMEMIDSIIEEHQSKTILKPYYGIDASLFEELNQQVSFCQKAAQCSTNREKTIQDIKSYVSGTTTLPLIIYGPDGCGKTTLMARVAQCLQQWLPEAFVILRFAGISAHSSTIEQLLNSITNQCSLLTYGHKSHCSHDIKVYEKVLLDILSVGGVQRPIIILLDGIDQIESINTSSIDWLPVHLPENIKVILSVTSLNQLHDSIMNRLDSESFVKMPSLGEHEAKGILLSSVMQYNHSVNSKVQDCVLKSVQECTLPLYCKVLAWQTSWWADREHNVVPKGNVNDQLDLMLEELETILGVTLVQHALAIMTCTRNGITDSEMIDLLAFDEEFQSSLTYVSWAPACLTWSRLNKHLAPFLQWMLSSGVLCVQWKDSMLRKAVTSRYNVHTEWANKMLYDYYTLIEDIYMYKNVVKERKFIELLVNFLETHSNTLNYDGRQFYGCFYSYIHNKVLRNEISVDTMDERILETYRVAENPPVLSLVPISYCNINSDDSASGDNTKTIFKEVNFNLITRLPETDKFIVSISTKKEDISVWNVRTCEKVRTLKGISHPTNLIPIDQYKCIVLCKRELRIYDLNMGKFVTKLKGVMNQKMPYFGLHDQSHLVALSRNRMYVNLMNLDSGNCRWSLIGHIAPVNLLRLDPTGSLCLSTDSDGRDRSIRIWDLNKGDLVSVYTPQTNISACEIMRNGQYILLALEGCSEIVGLQLKGPDVSSTNSDDLYGLLENTGKVFELKESDVC
ncbi:beta transducin-related protein [Holotrichia oblita]|uniref:Beta transducin-related protein n=1 Tax=Holotrichia oblita TaxID=644536 RepID=A0ACB9TMV2_HOLOL|nr:beta transducin-related protein [Holotrichia oblita]